MFPRLPERTRLFRPFKTHRQWTLLFLAPPTLLGVVDSYGIEWIHLVRQGRGPDRSQGPLQSPPDRGLHAVFVGQPGGRGRRLVGPCRPTLVDYVLAWLAFTVAASNLLIRYNGLKPDKHGFIPLSIAEFNL